MNHTLDRHPNGHPKRQVVDRPPKVLVAKPGLDGHDRGAKIIALALRDAGMEVVYTGLHQTPEQIVEAALDEDVDVIGMSILSGAHLPLTREVRHLLGQHGMDDVLLMVGGIIPARDQEILRAEVGVDGVFPVETSTEAIVAFIRQRLGIAEPSGTEVAP